MANSCHTKLVIRGTRVTTNLMSINVRVADDKKIYFSGPNDNLAEYKTIKQSN